MTTICRVLWNRLQLRSYRLHLTQAHKVYRLEFHANLANNMLLHDDKDFLVHVVFSDESTFISSQWT